VVDPEDLKIIFKSEIANSQNIYGVTWSNQKKNEMAFATFGGLFFGRFNVSPEYWSKEEISFKVSSEYYLRQQIVNSVQAPSKDTIIGCAHKLYQPENFLIFAID